MTTSALTDPLFRRHLSPVAHWPRRPHDAIAAVALGLVQRLVGAFEHGFEVGHVERGAGYSYADADPDFLARENPRMSLDLPAQPLRHDFRGGVGGFRLPAPKS